MSANADDPGEFLAFAQRSHPDAGASDFLPRELYGNTAAAQRREPCAAGPSPCLIGAAVAVERAHRRPGFHVYLADGRRVHADELVLATGNPGPAALPGHEKLRGSANYVGDPWKAPPRFRAGESVLIVGTGLTMADVVMAGTPHEGAAGADPCALRAAGSSRRHRRSVCRRRHRSAPRSSLSRAHEAPGSVVHLSRTVRRLAMCELARSGDDWRKVVTAIREARHRNCGSACLRRRGGSS